MSDVDKELLLNSNSAIAKLSKKKIPPQWIQCDLRTLDMSILGKFSVIMAGKVIKIEKIVKIIYKYIVYIL